MDSLEDARWLYRGVPKESLEVADVYANAEVRPPRPGRIGAVWRKYHVAGNTETGYTSWTTYRSIAEEAGAFYSDSFSGVVVIFRVRTSSLSTDQIFPGRDDEFEYLIEGTVEEVSVSESESAGEEESYDQ